MFIVVDLPSIFNDHSIGPIGTVMTMMIHHEFMRVRTSQANLYPIPIFPSKTEIAVEIWLKMLHVLRAQSLFLVAQSTTSVGNIYLFIG